MKFAQERMEAKIAIPFALRAGRGLKTSFPAFSGSASYFLVPERPYIVSVSGASHPQCAFKAIRTDARWGLGT